uniref:Hypothetical chloroplast protein RF1 n=1 Tax=Pseudomuriella schumacherensis TaxID=889459 RepID=A0A140HB83_PSESB|nr:hypothetical chloroplast protein RF1 [Pseudomuriella schumacherensis]AMO01432.1 hypothetical chloroplast protein RF1 [Pseudomuriella schumacherensis]
MFTILSLVTSVKDYVEVVHKLIESDVTNGVSNYYDFGAIITYIVITGKQFLSELISFSWLQHVWSLPIIVPDIAASMVSEISILDGYFQNAFTFLESPISYGNQNVFFYCLEKFSIGIINSIFLCLPTSIAHVITLRRFVMQGLEAGYIAGLGTIAGNVLWIGSVLFGLRCLVIPWLSLDILRYLLGFILLIKYMWDSYGEKRVVLEDLSKSKIFLLNFLLALTEQTSIYPYISNLSIGSDSTILESFPAQNFAEFVSIHGCYLCGILVGSLSLLQLTCWFWENPAYNFYMWFISSSPFSAGKITPGFYSKFLNFSFLYLTMLCAISNVAYFGLDYTLTNPLGLVHEDRLVEQKTLLETAFLNTKASDRNTRRNRGRHGRSERWKRRVRRYRTFDASLYDQGVYDLFTIEDLNYGFDRFWLRRKTRNHRARFRLFPGPWMRSFKKQLARPRLESFMGPRVEFFRILFEQVYHPEFHEFRQARPLYNEQRTTNLSNNKSSSKTQNRNGVSENFNFRILKTQIPIEMSIYFDKKQKLQKQGLIQEFSALRKFVRKVNTRMKASQITFETTNGNILNKNLVDSGKPVYSKRWKQIFSKLSHDSKTDNGKMISLVNTMSSINTPLPNESNGQESEKNKLNFLWSSTLFGNKNQIKRDIKKEDVKKRLSKKDRQILRYRTFLTNDSAQLKNVSSLDKKITQFAPSSEKQSQNLDTTSNNSYLALNKEIYKPLTLLHPLRFYLQKEQAFQRKLKFYGVNIFRNFGIENNAPYFKTMMRRFFYHYKPSKRWERTMRTATMRKARRKGPRMPRRLNINKSTQVLAKLDPNEIVSLPVDSQTEKIKIDSNFPKLRFGKFSREKIYLNKEKSNVLTPSLTQIQKPTHFYSLVSKRATRYRYEIYKDVLQHWYYSPFNRLLLKFDVDSFIRRQPVSHFLTKKDEQMLHLRRLLLSEHYETLRWYTQMQHYRSMKAYIGGTKSFANRVYNQQFMGTFKKIRHLFSITPSFADKNVYKFDQPLYNEFPNNEQNSIVEDSFIHEELLADEQIYGNKAVEPNDLKNQSALIIREYLLKAKPIREKVINNLLAEKNYWDFTKFLFKGQKIRGSVPITGQKSFLSQEKQLLYPDTEREEQQKLDKNVDSVHSWLSSKIKIGNMQQDIWIGLLKKCQNQLYNQESLKLYLAGHIEKREKQKQRQQKYLKLRLERMKKFSSGFCSLPENKTNLNDSDKNACSGLSTAIQKAVKDGIFFQKGVNQNKLNIRNNRPKIDFLYAASSNQKQNNIKSGNFNKSMNLKNYLKSRVKFRIKQIIQTEKDIEESLRSLNSIKDKNSLKFLENNRNEVSKKHFSIIQSTKNLAQLINRTITPFKMLPTFATHKIISPSVNFLLTPFKPGDETDLNLWRKQENVLSNRRKLRKTLKKLRKMNQNEVLQNQSTLDLTKLRLRDSDNKKKKKDSLDNNLGINIENQRRSKSWKYWQQNSNLLLLSGNAASNKNVSQPNNIDTITDSQVKKLMSMKNFASWLLSSTQKEFLRKRSRVRVYSKLKRNYSIKKLGLGEKLKRQFKLLKKYGTSDLEGSGENSLSTNKANKKVEILKLINNQNYEPENEFQTRETKQRRSRLRKNRFWKKHKKIKYAQTRRKLRKRRHYAVGKIRVLNKELKRKKASSKLQKWWWQTFLPNLQASTDTLWQLEKDQQIQNKLSQLSSAEILERDNKVTQNILERVVGEKMLQIGDKDYKPLTIPEAIRLREHLVEQEKLSFGIENSSLKTQKQQQNLNSSFQARKLEFSSKQNETNIDLIGKISKNSLTPDLSKTGFGSTAQQLSSSGAVLNPDSKNQKGTSVFMVGLNPLPFYAGWDETLRKFVVTNRLLSRKDAGYQFDFSKINNGMTRDYPTLKQLVKALNSVESQKNNFSFSQAPLQGMNAATTLYWQVPFTTYDPDQFFALGMDGFSPLGWQKFRFKHSKQTTKPLLVKTKTVSSYPFLPFNTNTSRKFEFRTKPKKNELNKSNSVTSNSFSLASNLQKKIFSDSLSALNPNLSSTLDQNKLTKRNQSRRIQKNYKRVKKYPRPPLWYPSGPLTNQVLPVHYIYVFYKRYRLPRDRYIRRRLRRGKDGSPKSIRESLTKMTDFTLRKRAKPRRKYHRKRIFKQGTSGAAVSSEKATLLGQILKRRKFRGFSNENISGQGERVRPSSKDPSLSSLSSAQGPNASLIKSKQRRKNKQPAENLRIRQLRRRVQRQVIRPTGRYKPQAGGFVWPGDYLRLELTQTPKLKTSSQPLVDDQKDALTIKKEGLTKQTTSSLKTQQQRKIRKKKRKPLPEWHIQPKKYLLQKHNINVLKKRLEKSQNVHKIPQRVVELTSSKK